MRTDLLLDSLQAGAIELHDAFSLDKLVERAGKARIVMIGEASHGTSEYYLWRIRLTQRLIKEQGFSFVAVEGDWPDCYTVNRYVKGYDRQAGSARDVLFAFNRWPTWMWANWEVAAFVEWLKEYNQSKTGEQAGEVGFYGLDVYSLYESLQAILDYLSSRDGQAMQAAREAFLCFDAYKSPETYARYTALVPEDCRSEVVSLLQELQSRHTQYADQEQGLNAGQNALVAVNAERYYRSMVGGNAESWNIRDTHMYETLGRLLDFYGADAKAVIWAHNTHVGDARATDMQAAGEINIGQLAREQYAGKAFLVGFGSYQGSVIAARSWGAEMEKMPVPEARNGSWEAVLHTLSAMDRYFFTADLPDKESRGHRAIGVVYHPDLEIFGNYVPTVLKERYDAFLYIDNATALSPLHIAPVIKTPPAAYPFGV